MLIGTELTDLRTRVIGADISGVAQPQLQALVAYTDAPHVPNSEGIPACSRCGANAPMCELAAERLDPSGEDGTVLVRGDFFCRSCLTAELSALQERLSEIHWIELSSLNWQPTAVVVTTSNELNSVRQALQSWL